VMCMVWGGVAGLVIGRNRQRPRKKVQ